jgi:catechol 2,3-dioxygenase-like lactoylglutathione lyase family enzyme
MISMKKRVTGLGGFFFKAKNPRKLGAWYQRHLGLPIDPQWGGWSFPWRDAKNPDRKGYTVWSPFAAGTGYFKPSRKPFMFNFRVENLKRVLAVLKREGVRVDPKIQVTPDGKFGWIMDPEGNRIELWEPPK